MAYRTNTSGVLTSVIIGVVALSILSESNDGSLNAPCPEDLLIAGGSSGRAGSELKLIFRNVADIALSLYWVSEDGEEVFKANLANGGSTEVMGFTGHLWRARDSNRHLRMERGLAHGPKRSSEVITIGACGAMVKPLGKVDASWLEQHGHLESPALEQCPLGALLSDVSTYGFHVACLAKDPDLKKGARRLCIFTDGLKRSRCTTSMVFSGRDPEELTERIGQLLEIQSEISIFTSFGRKIQRSGELFPQHRRVIIFIEGSIWQWPPVHIGYERSLAWADTKGKPVVLRTLSLQPRVFEVSDFLSDTDSKHIRKKATPKMAPSQDVLSAVGEEGSRSSETLFLASQKDTTLLELDERVQNLTRIPITHAEDLQVLRYDKGGRYGGHHDAFSPEFAARNEHTAQSTHGGNRNRALTVFVFLSDDFQGGETAFLRSGGLATPVNVDLCTSALSVQPTRGKVLLFYNLHPNGVFDQMSMHAGCPVHRGTKWAANFWFWNYHQDAKQSGRHKKMLVNLAAKGEADRLEEKLIAERRLDASINSETKHVHTGPETRDGEL